jgi:hypothetical protein
MRKIFLTGLMVAAFSSALMALPFAWGSMIQPKSFFGDSKPRAVKYNNGYIYVYGRFKDTIDLNMGNGTKFVNAYDANNFSGYLAKYDLQGNFIWGGSLKGIKTGNPNCPAPPYNEIMDMTFDASNNVYLTGYYDDSVRFEFGGTVKGLKSPCGVSEFIVKLNPGGDVLIADHVTGMQCPTYFSGTSISLDKGIGLYTLTDFYGTGDFDFSAGQKIYNHQIYSKFNIVVSKYNRNTMALDWSGMLVCDRTLYGESILVDNDKNMYVSGKFVGMMDVDLSPAVNNISTADTTHFDYFMVKYDSNGVFQWVNQFTYGGGFDFDVSLDNSNHILLAGNFKDHIGILHNNISQGNLTSNGAASDLFCMKLDLGGNIIWSKRIGGTYDEYYQGMSVSASDQILLNGWFNLATGLNPASMSNDYTIAGMATNGLISCLSPNGDFVFGGISNALGNPNNQGIGGAIYSCSVWDPAGNIYLAGQNIWQSDINPDTNANASNMVNNTNNNFNTFVMKLGTNSPNALTEIKSGHALTCYPSPAKDYCVLQSENENIQSVEVYTAMGQLVAKARPESRTFRLDLHSYSNGTYYVKYMLEKQQGFASFTVSK